MSVRECVCVCVCVCVCECEFVCVSVCVGGLGEQASNRKSVGVPPCVCLSGGG